MTDKSENQNLANAVKEVLAGKNYRDEAERIGLHFTVLYDLAKGRSKSRPTIVKFARGFGLSVNEWLALYGYEPEDPEPDPSGRAIYRAGLKALKEEFGRPIPVDNLEEDMEPAEAFRQLASLRDQLERGVI